MKLIFCTGNNQKFLTARQVCREYSIDVTQKKIQTFEIQEEDAHKVALDKATKAFKVVGKPIIISDDSWNFIGLRGFPGVYMHSMNEWLTPEDFLRLTLPLTDRRVILTMYLVYYDGKDYKSFKQLSAGKLLKEKHGTSAHPSHTVMSMQGDDGLSIAEALSMKDNGTSREVAQVWHEFAKWYSNK